MTDKDPAAVALGRKGGKAGTGESKRRSGEHYRQMQEKSAEAQRARKENPPAPTDEKKPDLQEKGAATRQIPAIMQRQPAPQASSHSTIRRT